MRPDVLAVHLASTIRGLVEPLHKTVHDQANEIRDLKHALAALEANSQRHAAALAVLTDENKALGATLVACLEPLRRAPSSDTSDGRKH